MTLKKNYLLDVLLMLALLAGCVKDEFDYKKLKDSQINPEIAVPLVYSSLTFADILGQHPNSTITVDSNHFCTLVYKGKLFSLRADELIEVPSQSAYQTYALTGTQINTLTTIGTISFSAMQAITVSNAANVTIDSMEFKSGTLDIAINSEFLQNGQLQITIPSLKKNGITASQTVPINYNNGVPFNVGNPGSPVASFDLTGYKADLTNGGTTINQLKLNYTITLTQPGAAPTTATSLFVNCNINQPEFKNLFGYFGQMQLAPDVDSLELSVFNNAFGMGSFTVVNPQMIFSIENSFGLPVRANITRFDAYNSNNGNFTLSNLGIPNPLPVNSPTVNQIGQSMSTSFTLTRQNSDVYNIVSQKPQMLIYKIDALSNPSGTQQTNFVIDSSMLALNLEVDLPMYGTANDFAVQDTFDFKFDNIDKVESMLIHSNVTNGFPIDVEMQIYFTDENFNLLDSLFIPGQVILPAALVNIATGYVINSSSKTTDVDMTPLKISHLNTTKKMLVRATATTLNNGTTNIKIYDFYKLNVTIGAKAKMKIIL